MRATAWGIAIVATCVVGSASAQLPEGRRADSATATWDSAGFVVRFPRAMSPDSITLDMLVGDNFSGYEWRVALVGDSGDALLTAFVIPPDDTLALRRYRTIAEAFRAGDLRRCRRTASVLECSVPARGFLRDAAGHIEIGIRDASWLRFALASRRPRILVVVKRDRQEVWSDEFALVLPDRGT